MCMNTPPPSYAFASRYGQYRSITRISSTQYLIEGDTLYMRGGEDPQSGSTMADFEGGPFLMTGVPLAVAVGDLPCVSEGAIIKSAKSVDAATAVELLGLRGSHWVKAMDKPDYAYVLVETD
jgi:hypothetical protein